MPTLGVAVESRKAVTGMNNVTTAFKRGRESAGKFAKGVGRADKSMNKAGVSGLNLKRVLGGVITGFAAFAILRSTIRLIADFERTLATLKGVANATDKQLAHLEKTARDLGKATQFSAKEAAEGLLFLARAGFTVEEAITAIPATLNLAIAGLLDLGEAADIASNVLAQFGLEIEDTTRVTDILVKTANSANTDIRQLAEALKLAGPVAGAVGKTLEETAAAIGTLGNAGIQASLAGTNLRGIMAALLSPTEKIMRSLDRLNLTFGEVNPATQDLVSIFEAFRRAGLGATEAVNIFGRRNVAAGIILTNNVDILKDLKKKTENAGGAAQRQADIIKDTLAGAFLELKSAIQEVALSTGDRGLGQAIRTVVESLTFLIRGFEEVDDVMEDSILFWIKEFTRFKFTVIGVADVIKASFKDIRSGVISVGNVLLAKPLTGLSIGDPTTISATAKAARNAALKLAEELRKIEDAQEERRKERLRKAAAGAAGPGGAATGGISLAGAEALVSATTGGPRTGVLSAREAELAEEEVRRIQHRNEVLRTSSQIVKELIAAEKLRVQGLNLTEDAREVLIARTEAQNIVEAEAVEIAKAAGLTDQGRVVFIQQLVEGKKAQIDQLTQEIIKRQKLEEQLKRATQLGRSIGNVMSRSLENILLSMDKIIDKTFDWRNALRAVAKDLARIAVRQFVTQPLGQLIGSLVTGAATGGAGAGAGGAGTLTELPSGVVVRGGGAAEGAILTRPTMTLAGESGPEAILPLKRGRDGKLGVAMEGGGGQRPIIMHFHGVTDIAGFKRSKPQLAAFFRRALSK